VSRNAGEKERGAGCSVTERATTGHGVFEERLEEVRGLAVHERKGGGGRRRWWVALTGNPNCGKTTLFNALTGLRAKVGNYAGVTVERKEGRMKGVLDGREVWVLDLPGSYSLSPQSLDEEVARDVLFGRLDDVPVPDVVVVVVDASNLERNLYYAMQVIELGRPTVVALNMSDVAEQNGHWIDTSRLSERLGVPVARVVASLGEGMDKLRPLILEGLELRRGPRDTPWFCRLPGPMDRELESVVEGVVAAFPQIRAAARAEGLLLLSDEKAGDRRRYPVELQRVVGEARVRLEAAGVDWRGAAIESRYERASEIHDAVTREEGVGGETLSDRLDRVVTHRWWGPLIFLGIMGLMFQSLFSFAQWPMEGMELGVAWIGGVIGGLLGPGELRGLLVDGVVAGVGAVLVFLPQILLLFLFIGLLEDSGYMARAAFLMDRLMSKVGLHGKSFIPMLSSFACAIPGVMATRTIETPRDRLVTILVAPLMSCAARLPVYALLIGACIPDERVFGFVRLQGLTMLGMYLLGIVVALLMAWLFKKTLLRGETPLLILELPPYRKPVFRIVLRHMWERGKIFIHRAGTVILGISIVLWFLASYPRNEALGEYYDGLRTSIEAAGAVGMSAADEADAERIRAWFQEQLVELDREEAGERLRESYAGRLGRSIEPFIRPLGFDWKIGIGILASFAAREVFVSTMSTVYSVGGVEETVEGVSGLAETLRSQTGPDGEPVYTIVVGLALMVFYVFALQCVSTVAIVRRETNSWRWPLFQWLYMAILAWGMAFLTFQVGRWLTGA
jgi:ferrous iron transport protein B